MVGPNGSGKSNVIDAMLFVFGKRAKQLRLNKVSELIHNSTDFRDLSHARVEVHFREIVDSTTDEEAFTPVPGSDFVIAREAYKNNTSKYFIDTKTSNFTEVTTLLKKHGVDLNNNRFLILQGEVEQISMMKVRPSGLSQIQAQRLPTLFECTTSNTTSTTSNTTRNIYWRTGNCYKPTLADSRLTLFFHNRSRKA